MRPDSFVLETRLDPYLRIKLKNELKGIVLLLDSPGYNWIQLDTESLADVQFVIDSCRLVSQSKFLNSSYKDCDWLILACFIRE